MPLVNTFIPWNLSIMRNWLLFLHHFNARMKRILNRSSILKSLIFSHFGPFSSENEDSIFASGRWGNRGTSEPNQWGALVIGGPCKVIMGSEPEHFFSKVLTSGLKLWATRRNKVTWITKWFLLTQHDLSIVQAWTGSILNQFNTGSILVQYWFNTVSVPQFFWLR